MLNDDFLIKILIILLIIFLKINKINKYLFIMINIILFNSLNNFSNVK
jgi:hypothetical protein